MKPSDSKILFLESESHSIMSNSLWPHGLYSPWNSPGHNTAVGSLSLLWGIFSTQGLNPGLQHCRMILCQLIHKGSPRILEWVAYPFSKGSSWPRNQTGVCCICRQILYQLNYQVLRRLLNTVSTSVLQIDQFIFSISSWFSLWRLYHC